jgi:hypothetical protein
MLSCNRSIKFLKVGDLVECCCDNSYAGWGVVTRGEKKNSFASVLFFDEKHILPLEVYPFEIMNVIRDGVQCVYDP